MPARRPGGRFSGAALALATWSQLGAYATDTVASSPHERLGRLVLAARAGARWSADTAFLDLVAAWDAVVGADSIAAVHAATDGFDGFVRRTVAQDSPVGMAALLSPELLLPGEKSLQPAGRAYIRQFLGLTAVRVIR